MIKTLQEKNYFCSVLYKDKYCYMYWTSGQKKAKIRTDFLRKMKLIYAEIDTGRKMKIGVD